MFPLGIPFNCMYIHCTLQWLTVTVGDTCQPGYYSTTEDPLDCIPCSVCGVGQGILVPCGGSNNTICTDCLDGQYSALTSTGRVCIKCKDCGPERIELSLCTATQDSICGRCSEGYFLYVGSDNSECMRCSKCPPDEVVLHWLDCVAAGEPEDNQCAPGTLRIQCIYIIIHPHNVRVGRAV